MGWLRRRLRRWLGVEEIRERMDALDDLLSESNGRIARQAEAIGNLLHNEGQTGFRPSDWPTAFTDEHGSTAVP